METNLKDITSEEDIKKLVDDFYKKVNQDAMLSPVFNEHAHVNWDNHLPVMYRFWSSILLGTSTYNGHPFPKHAFLPVNQTHFAQWLLLFYETITENFRGPIAEEAKFRAASIARIFSNKIRVIQGQESPIGTLNNHTV
ncbi:group III truncated hemoglobin [Adhaeribacter aquaticus]|uniref:group III truncated hemoglobin n=1 Tax=Adhaeribacter aquaticus TaxID=299567 RepID=UPI0003FB94AA|nr:group III truncated hemoglobin [Adhaeribacter aquaticus]